MQNGSHTIQNIKLSENKKKPAEHLQVVRLGKEFSVFKIKAWSIKRKKLKNWTELKSKMLAL